VCGSVQDAKSICELNRQVEEGLTRGGCGGGEEG
jgi:hypothetical protein